MRHLPKNIGDMEKYRTMATTHGMQSRGLLRYNGVEGVQRFECIATGLNLDDHWVFVNDVPHENCLLQWDILNQQFGLIPSYCQRSCWKIVVKCKTVYEMMQVHEIMTDLGLYGKVGIDERPYTAGVYNCFIYNKSFDEAERNYREIAPCIIRDIGNHFKRDYMDTIIVKRGCTEMEMQQPSGQWQITPEILKTEKTLGELIKTPDDLVNAQPEWLVEYKVFRWCAKASSFGDFSYREVPELSHLVFHVRSQTYHNEDWIDGKKARLPQ